MTTVGKGQKSYAVVKTSSKSDVQEEEVKEGMTKVEWQRVYGELTKRVSWTSMTFIGVWYSEKFWPRNSMSENIEVTNPFTDCGLG